MGPGHDLAASIIDQFRADPDSTAILARALEVPLRASEGGHAYCALEGATAVFTRDHPGGQHGCDRTARFTWWALLRRSARVG